MFSHFVSCLELFDNKRHVTVRHECTAMTETLRRKFRSFTLHFFIYYKWRVEFREYVQYVSSNHLFLLLAYSSDTFVCVNSALWCHSRPKHEIIVGRRESRRVFQQICRRVLYMTLIKLIWYSKSLAELICIHLNSKFAFIPVTIDICLRSDLRRIYSRIKWSKWMNSYNHKRCGSLRAYNSTIPPVPLTLPPWKYRNKLFSVINWRFRFDSLSILLNTSRALMTSRKCLT